MTADLSLKSIEFKASGGALSSVRCTLTNGVSSPLFEKAGVDHNQNATYNFDPKKKVCKVELSSNGNSAGNSHVTQIKFFDSANAELFMYKTYEPKFPAMVH